MSIKDRGFASMSRDKQRQIAAMGGRAAHKKGTAHVWTSDEAREAGRKGGRASATKTAERNRSRSYPNPNFHPTNGNE